MDMTASATFTETRLPVFVVKKNGVDRMYPTHVLRNTAWFNELFAEVRIRPYSGE